MPISKKTPSSVDLSAKVMFDSMPDDIIRNISEYLPNNNDNPSNMSQYIFRNASLKKALILNDIVKNDLKCYNHVIKNLEVILMTYIQSRLFCYKIMFGGGEDINTFDENIGYSSNISNIEEVYKYNPSLVKQGNLEFQDKCITKNIKGEWISTYPEKYNNYSKTISVSKDSIGQYFKTKQIEVKEVEDKQFTCVGKVCRLTERKLLFFFRRCFPPIPRDLFHVDATNTYIKNKAWTFLFNRFFIYPQSRLVGLTSKLISTKAGQFNEFGNRDSTFTFRKTAKTFFFDFLEKFSKNTKLEIHYQPYNDDSVPRKKLNRVTRLHMVTTLAEHITFDHIFTILPSNHSNDVTEPAFLFESNIRVRGFSYSYTDKKQPWVFINPDYKTHPHHPNLKTKYGSIDDQIFGQGHNPEKHLQDYQEFARFIDSILKQYKPITVKKHRSLSLANTNSSNKNILKNRLRKSA